MRSDVPGRGRDLRVLRLAAGLSQEELAAKAGVGTRTIRDIETGRATPQPRTLRLLIEALELGDADRETLMRSTARPTIVPRELPPPLAGFAGREAQLAAMRTAVTEGARVIAVHGMAGVGKTSLAVEFAHEIGDGYTDAQLFVDLHGFTTSVAPRPSTRSVLTRVLRALGVPDQAVPTGSGELLARYRSILADRRVLLVFDNIAGAAALQELLPASPGSLVIATSRRELSTLPGAFAVALEPASRTEAAAMLRAALPGHTQPGEDTAIAERCGRLPLAIGLAAARLRSRPKWTAADLLVRLSNEERLLDALDIGYRGVTAALRASYLELGAEQRLVFRSLGLAPGDDLDRTAATALSGLPEDTVDGLLESLVDVHLIETRSFGRYRLHDLVRLFAERLVALENSEADRGKALLRLLAAYRQHAYQAAAELWPGKRIFTSGAEEFDIGLAALSGKQEALDWYRAELGNLTAAVAVAEKAGEFERAWELAVAVNAFSAYDRDLDAQAEVNGVALAIAERLRDPFKKGHTLADRGALMIAAGRYPEAVTCLEQSVAFKREAGDHVDTARTLGNLGLLHKLTGRFERSLEQYEAALALIGTQRGPVVGPVHINIAIVLFKLGRVDEAARRLHEAQSLIEPDDTYTSARIRVYQGVVARERGDLAAAVGIHTDCLEFCLREGIPVGIVSAMTMLGEDLLCAGRHDEAVARLREALDIARTSVRDTERDVRNHLGEALTAAGEPEAAIQQHERAARLAESQGDRYELARAHRGLAVAHRRLADVEAERRHLRRAADGYTECGVPEAVDVLGRLRDLGA
ncbi:tetratricopeptide repeat protein [Phytomonospora sp. NPDC050363]|uniref:ATP-binding protein n=1 Tax=Phytomonospora sp. NPDC050363 TaxID=3155642 RepID=UPI0033D0E8C0